MMTKNLQTKVLLVTTLLFTAIACSDDTGISTGYNDGYLHLKFLLNNDGQWNEDGTPRTQTRMMAPVEMTLPDGFDTPLYLHCTEQNSIETAPVTRGERITGEAFDSRDKIKCFGLYAVVDGQQVLATATASYTEIKRNELSPSGDWQVKEATLNFAGDDGWPSGKTGDFYGFAPFPGWDADDDAGNGHARCIVINTDSPTSPTITFFMQPEEERNKDILTAKQTGVTQDGKDAGVELQFQHILSALKFKLDDDDTDGNGTNDLKYTVGVSGTEYYLQVKSITVDGIYDQGTVGIGNTYTDLSDGRTSNWTVDETSTGSCTATLNRSYDDITSDTKKLINTDEHCMMVLPQTAPTGAKLIITADLTADAAGTTPYQTDVTFEASLEGLTWLPGYSYTYKISKDTKAFSYTLTSVYNGVNGGAFTFDVNGGAFDFDVLSNVTYTDESTPATTQPSKWHIEHTTDGGTTWEQGLPLGFSVVNKSTGKQVDEDLAILNSTTSPETYTIVATKRQEEVPSIVTLTSHDYNQYAGDDGYYDLSLHGMGFSPEVCAHTSARNTANCYVVSGYGKFKLPLVYGNGVKQGVNNPIAYAYTWNGEGHGVFLDHTGRQINDPWITTQLGHALTSAEIIWEENDVIKENSVKLSDDGDYLCFEIEKQSVQPGNILLAVRDANGIAWSWHIWVMAFDFANNTTTLSCNVNGTTRTMTFAQRDLGWRTPIIKNYNDGRNIQIRVVQNDLMGEHVDHNVTQNGGVVSFSGSNLVYQNGRKDPFPFLRSDMTGYTVNSSTGKIESITYATTKIFDSVCSIYDTSRPSSAYCIMHPDQFSAHASSSNNPNWFTEVNSTYPGRQIYPCWDPEASLTLGGAALQEFNYTTHTKTIYDPCPVGFMVPKSGALTILNYSSYTSSSSNTPRTWSYNTQTTTLDGETVASPLPYIESGDIRFYLTGGMTYTYTGSNGATIGSSDTNTYGYIWSTGFTSNASYSVYGRATTSGFQHRQASNDRYSFYGLAVRPVVDDQQGIIEPWDGATVQNFHQADVTDINLVNKSGTTDWGISNLSSVSFTVGGNTFTLQNFLNDTGKNNKRIYIKNIRVYFTYNGYTYGLLLEQRTLSPYSIAYGSEEKGSSAFVLVSSIPDHYQFSANWARRDRSGDNITAATWWESLVPLITSNVEISSVVADLRITYTD